MLKYNWNNALTRTKMSLAEEEFGRAAPAPIDEYVIEAAKQAVREHNKKSDDPNYCFSVEILAAKAGLLCGTIYFIKMLIGKSTTLKKYII
uniref:Cystatin domain-containing protein n=1 Tax=Ditylenchus dipsaci TaxID=166011 RepID=A0A915DEG2_9BILA